MSSALTLASVTALLRSLLEDGLAQAEVTAALGGDVTVSALPPDRIAAGADERPQLNLFLYQLSPHTGLQRGLRPGFRAADAPSDRPPLALDLYYLLTAYGAQDLQAEILLGYAVQIMHQQSALSADWVRSTLKALSKPAGGRGASPINTALGKSDLADQAAEIRITPHFLTAEETSRLWSALQARYRPSAAYQVSTVAIGLREAA